MKTDVYMMYGFPGQEKEEFFRDLRLIESLEEEIDWINWHFLSLLPGTEYFDWALKSKRVQLGLYRRLVGEGYGFFYPIDEFNLSLVPTQEFRGALGDLPRAWS